MKIGYTLSVNFKEFEIYTSYSLIAVKLNLKNDNDNLKSHNLKIKNYLWKVRRTDWRVSCMEARIQGKRLLVFRGQMIKVSLRQCVGREGRDLMTDCMKVEGGMSLSNFQVDGWTVVSLIVREKC